MKIKPEHFAHIKAAIDTTIAKHGEAAIIAAYETGNIPRADKVKNLQERLCFDLLHYSGLTPWVCDNIYTYANDDHLFTALRKICPTVTRRY